MLSLTVKEKELVVLSNGTIFYVSRIRGASVQVSVGADRSVTILRGKFIPDDLKDKIKKGTWTQADIDEAFQRVALQKQ